MFLRKPEREAEQQMNGIELQYQELLQNILTYGVEKEDRTGVGCVSVFHKTLLHNFNEGFPLFTIKKMWFRGVWEELKWFLSGAENMKSLEEGGAGAIWRPWAQGEELWTGKIYGPSWRNFNGQAVDQLKNVIAEIKKNPSSRRHLVVAWNPVAVWGSDVCLAPCHYSFCFQADGPDKLNLAFQMRSSDAPVGLPWNIAFYSLLLSMVCHLTGRTPGKLGYYAVDPHIYLNQIEGVRELLKRTPTKLPRLEINSDAKTIDDFEYKDFKLIDYNPQSPVQFEVAVGKEPLLCR